MFIYKNLSYGGIFFAGASAAEYVFLLVHLSGIFPLLIDNYSWYNMSVWRTTYTYDVIYMNDIMYLYDVIFLDITVLHNIIS